MMKKSTARSKKTRAAAKATPRRTKTKKTGARKHVVRKKAVAKKATAAKPTAGKPAAKTARTGPVTRTTSVVAWPGLPPGYFTRGR